MGGSTVVAKGQSAMNSEGSIKVVGWGIGVKLELYPFEE